MKSNRLLFQLAPSTLHTEEIGSGLLRTADAHMERGSHKPEKLIERYQTKHLPLNLNDQIQMLGTPSTRDHKDGNSYGAVPEKSLLPRQVRNKTGLKLQPNFVEWMMGYPQNWTDLNSPNPNTELKG
jgi:hypothetical protein